MAMGVCGGGGFIKEWATEVCGAGGFVRGGNDGMPGDRTCDALFMLGGG